MKAILSPKRTNQLIYTRSPNLLPKDFAEQVLHIEGSLDSLCDINSIKRLAELYSQAIEYYGAAQDPKYLHYKRRLQSLYQREDVLFLLQYPETGCISRGSSHVRNRRKYLKSLDCQRSPPIPVNDSRNAETVFSEHNYASLQASREVIADLESQRQKLDSKLQERRHQSYGLKDRSKQEALQDYENRIECIMEWYCLAKRRVRQEIEAKYPGLESDRVTIEIEEAHSKLEIQKRSKIDLLGQTGLYIQSSCLYTI